MAAWSLREYGVGVLNPKPPWFEPLIPGAPEPKPGAQETDLHVQELRILHDITLRVQVTHNHILS